MKHYKVLVKFLIMLIFISCKKNVSKQDVFEEVPQEVNGRKCRW